MRIATSFIHQLAAADIQRAQREMFEAQRQAGSEKKATDIKGYAREASPLVTARSHLERANAFAAAGVEVKNRLAAQALSLGRVSKAGVDVKLALTEALALDKGDEMMSRVSDAFASALEGLNSSYAGRRLFGGIRDDAAPVTIDTLDDLLSPALVSDAFANASRKATVQLDARTTLEVAPLADEVATALFESFQRIKQYENDNGAFSGQLTAAQRTFIESEIAQLDGVVQGLHAVEAANGSIQARVDRIIDRQSDEKDYFYGLVGDIENVDLADVASRLSQAQVQLQASAQVYLTLRDTTLLNYLSPY